MNFNLKRGVILPIAFFCFSTVNMAQETKPAPATSPKPATPATQPSPQASPAPNPFAKIPPAKPEDVSTIDNIVKALYEVISGDPGVKRDWNRFRSLFYPNAKMVPTFKNRNTGKIVGLYLTPEEYIERSGPLLEKDGFHETGIAQRVEQFGNIAHVFTSYQSKRKLTDEKPFMRGINSIQLINDGTRWWVLNIAWSQETPDSPIPEKYLKSVQ
ncbi:MAG: brain acid soluble protein 1 [Acidobacteriota bacterium]|nr:brain acid soluble protein 1 [Acidobacteriota bacterium]